MKIKIQSIKITEQCLKTNCVSLDQKKAQVASFELLDIRYYIIRY